MFDMLRRVALDHASNNGQRDGPDRSQLVVVLFKKLVQACAWDRGHQRHVAQQGNGRWLLEVAAWASADSVGAVLEDYQEREGQEGFEAVGAGGMLGSILCEL